MGKKKVKQPKKRRLSSRESQLGRISTGLLVLVMIFVLGVAYLLQVNDTSTKGYDIIRLEQKVAELQESNSRLELEAVSLQSLKTIEDRTSSMLMVPSTQVHYLSGTDYAFQQ